MSSIKCLAVFTLFLFTTASLHAQTSMDKKQDPSIKSERGTPINYYPVDNELKISEPHINYDLGSSSGTSLKIGGLEINDKSFYAELDKSILTLKWNTQFIKGGNVTMFDRFGKSIWEQSINGNGSWTASSLGGKNAPNFPVGEKFRFCIIDGNKKGFSSLCSQWYGAKNNTSGIELIPLKGELLPRVIINNEEQKLSGIKKVAVGDNVQFFASLKSEVTFEFLSVPKEIIIRDLIQAENKDNVNIVGVAPGPLDVNAEYFPEIKYSKFVKSIHFEDTILPDASYWKIEIPLKSKKLLFPGTGGGVFEYPIEIQNPPKSKDRYYSSNLITGTYQSEDQVDVWKGEETKSSPPSDDKKGKINWKFQALEKFKLNRTFLEVTDEDKQNHKLYLDIYRGTQAEASFRMDSILGAQDGVILFGEVHLSWWFNDLFDWQNPYLSKQRWGISARHFTTITKVSAQLDNGGNEDSKLSVTDIDINYRFTPGLWERDETVGLILSQESGDFGRHSLSKLGVGLFWARSMPKVFDDWFNNFSIFKYPKWVDMSFINYVSSMTSGAQLNNDFVVNFHGKVLWTPTFFGEAGFGYKRYGFRMSESNEDFRLQTFYGSLGIGINF